MALLALTVSFLLSLSFILYIAHASAFTVRTKAQIEDYIIYQAQSNNLNTSLVLSIAKCESVLDTNSLASTEKEYSLGIFQINLKAHTTIKEWQARNPVWNVNWAIDRMIKYGFEDWMVCWKRNRELATSARR